MPMENKAEKTTHFLWVDWSNHVISFHAAEGFVRLEFPSHREMVSFAAEKGSVGFAIQ